MAVARGLVVDIALNVAKIQSDISKTQSAFSDLQRSIKKTAVVIGQVTAAVLALRGAYSLAEQAAKFDQAEQAFTNLAASHGANAKQIIESLRQVSGETISTANIMQSAGKAMLLGIDPGKLDEMMQIARNAARITGDSVQKSFEDIAVGVGRQSKLILDNLGIVVDAQKAYDTYAASLGKTSSQLTDTEKKQAFLNATLAAGQDIVKRVGANSLTAAEAMDKWKATIENLKIVLGKVVIAITSGLAAALQSLVGMFQFVLGGLIQLIGKFVELGSKLPVIGKQFHGLAEEIKIFGEIQSDAANARFKDALAAFRVAEGIFAEKEAVVQLRKEMETPIPVPEPDFSAFDEFIKKTQEVRDFQKNSTFAGLEDNQAVQAFTKYEEDLAALESYSQKRQDIIDGTFMSEEQRAQENANLTVEIEKRKRDLLLDSIIQTGTVINNFLGNLATANIVREKKAFEIQKKISTAQAIVYTLRGVAKALEIPPPAGWVAAAVTLATGMAQVAKIKATSVDGGGASGGGIGSGGSVGGFGPIGESADTAVVPNNQTQPSQNVTINIENGTGDKAYWQELVDDVIIPGINSASQRNINLTIREG